MARKLCLSFRKKPLSLFQISSCFSKRKVNFLHWHYLKLGRRIKKKTEAKFCYSDIEDFDKPVLTTLPQNRGDSLLMKEGQLC